MYDLIAMRKFKVQYVRAEFELENNKNIQMWDVKKEFCAKHPQSWYSNKSLKPEILDISCNGVLLDNEIKLDEIVHWRDTLIISEKQYQSVFDIMVKESVSSNSERTHWITVQDSNTIWVVKRIFCDKLIESDKLMVNLNPESIQFSLHGDELNDAQILNKLGFSDGDTIMAVEILRNTTTQFSVQYLGNVIDLRMDKSTQMWDVKKEFCEKHSPRGDNNHRLKPENSNISHDGVLLANDVSLNKICVNAGGTLIITDRECIKEFVILVQYRAISVRITVQDSNTIWVVKRKLCDKIIEDDNCMANTNPECVELSLGGDVLNDGRMLGNLNIGEGDTIIAIDTLRNEMRRIRVKYLVSDTELSKDERTLMWDVKKEVCIIQSKYVLVHYVAHYSILYPQKFDIYCCGVLLENDVSLKKLCVNDGDALIMTDRKYNKEFVVSVQYKAVCIEITVQDSSAIWVVKRLFLDKLIDDDNIEATVNPECVTFSYRGDVLNDNQILANLGIGENDRIIAEVIRRIISFKVEYLADVTELRMEGSAQMWDVKREVCTKLTQCGGANDRLKPDFIDIYRNGVLLKNDVTLITSVKYNDTLRLTERKFETEFDIVVSGYITDKRWAYTITVQDSDTVWDIKRKFCDKLFERHKSFANMNPKVIGLSFDGVILDNADILSEVGIGKGDTIVTVPCLKG